MRRVERSEEPESEAEKPDSKVVLDVVEGLLRNEVERRRGWFGF